MDYSKENKQTFFARLDNKVIPSELVKIQTAYMLAKYAHRAQQRKETDRNGRKLRYFEHVRRVALIVMDSYRDKDGIILPDWNWQDICVALLHDTLEDTQDITPQILEGIFGSRVCRLVMALTKTTKNKGAYPSQVYNGGQSCRFIKMCDRLDNLRSLNGTGITKEFKAKQKKETLDVWLFGPFIEFEQSGIWYEIESICR